MTKTGRHGIYVLGLGFILVVALVTGLAAQEKPGQSPPQNGSSTISPEMLPDVLAAATDNLENMIAELRMQRETEGQTLKNEIGHNEDIRARIAALNASMAVNELSLAGAKEVLQNLNSEKEKTTTNLKEITKRQQALEIKIQNQAEALSTVKIQVAKLAETNHTVSRSQKFLTFYQKYLQQAKEYDLEAKNYRKILGKKEENLQSQIELLSETKTKIEKEYLEKAFEQEVLRRQSFRDQVQQIGQSLTTLAELPEKMQTWIWVVYQTGALKNFAVRNLTNLIGLGLVLAVVVVGTNRLKKLMLPRQKVWQEQLSEFNLKGFLVFIQISVNHLFSVGFVVWLYLAFWRLEIISSKVAWLVWSLVGTLVVLNLVLKLIQRFFAGDKAGGILPLAGDLASYYRIHLQLLASYFLLWHFFVLANAEELGLSLEIARNLKTFSQAVLLGWVLWLLGNRRLEVVLAALPLAPVLKNKSFLRILRSTAVLAFAIVVISGLLGFKFLFEYVAQGAAFTMIVLTLAWIFGAAASATLRLSLHPEIGALAQKYPGHKQHFKKSYRIILQTVKIALTGVALLLTLKVWGIPLERVSDVFQWLNKGSALGPIRLTPFTIGLTISICYLGFWLSRLFRTFLEHQYYPRKNWDPGIQYTISMTTHYVILTITILLAMNIMGVTLTSLALVAGGLGVGIGFGLQNIISNFLSGLILLFERPIKVGDMLIIDGQWGTVKEIRVRSTIFQTFDRYFLIIPNSELISGKILNWTYAGWGLNRLTLKVGVSYDSDPAKVTKIIEAVCRANDRVVPEPPPQIFFEAYGDSSLDFNIWVHLSTPGDRIPATHELNSAIFEAFQNHSIEIPFPQRDLHVRSWAPGAVPAISGSEDYHATGDKTDSRQPVWNG